MCLPTFLVLAALGLKAVQADFLVITNAPAPTPTGMSSDQLSSWISSVNSKVNNRAFSWISEHRSDSSLANLALEAATEAVEFFETATISIPPGIIEVTTAVTFTSQPDWFTAMPSEMQEWNNKLASAVASIKSEEYSKAPAAKATAAIGFGAGMAVAAVAGALL